MSTSTASSNPFPGLRPYTFEDAWLFFGRDRQISKLRTKLERHRFSAVVGRSGDGKSSLVRAGLVPLLASEKDDDGKQLWIWDEMRPGGAPLAELAELVDRIACTLSPERNNVPYEIRQGRTLALLRKSSLGLAVALGEAARNNTRRILILVDQFEEIFRFDRREGRPEDFEEAAAFVDLILQASRASVQQVNVVITMRSDYLGDCPRFRELPEAINDSQFLVPRLTRDERRQVIEKPVVAMGATIAPALVQRLINDVGDAPDMLPVLQHALMRIWNISCGSGSTTPHLTLEHYQALGGIENALSYHADEIFGALDSDGQEVTRIAFQALVDVDQEGRAARRAPAPRFEALVALCGEERRAALRHALDEFRGHDCSFLMPPSDREINDDTVIDISHEALIRRWRRIGPWIEAEQADARVWRLLLEEVDAGTPYLSGQVARDRIAWCAKPRQTGAWAKRYGGREDEVGALLTSTRGRQYWDLAQRFLPAVAGGLLILAVGAIWFNLELNDANSALTVAVNDANTERIRAEKLLDELTAEIQRANSAERLADISQRGRCRCG